MEITAMNLCTQYDGWHQRVFAAAPNHEDALSPWYRLVREMLGPATDQRILEVA
jgi:hypothetical protein